ncbi:MAG: hypothetical protein WC562_04175 [Dehalococcoidia bacterium]
MKISRFYKTIALWLAVCTMACFAAVAVPGYSAAADGGGIALSGTFSSKTFEIPQGSSVEASNVNIVVFNNDDESIGINLTGQCPTGVSLVFSESSFELAPDSHKTVSIVSIDVTTDAVPGEYEVSITAEAYTTGVEGIQLLGSVRQTASLTVTGESGTVSVQTVSPDGIPVPARIRLFKVIGSSKVEFAYSDTGLLNATVSPGSYVAEGYVGGKLLDEESFDIAAGETKTISLTVETIYFYHFAVLEYFNSDTGNLAYVEIQYTVKNVYEEVDDASILLDVTLDGEPLEQKTIAPPNRLTLDGVNGVWEYTPLEGWKSGDYSFKLILKIGDEVYTYSTEKQLDVTGDASVGGSNTPLIIGIVCAIVVVFAVALYMILKKRKAKAPQPQSKKKGKEESKPQQ